MARIKDTDFMIEKLKKLNDQEIVSYFKEYLNTNYNGIIRDYEKYLLDLEKAGDIKRMKTVQKTLEGYRELKILLNQYLQFVGSINRPNSPYDPEAMEERLQCFRSALRTSKEIVHFDIPGYKRTSIDRLTMPSNPYVSVIRKGQFSGAVRWPGMKQVLTEMNKRVKIKIDSLDHIKDNIFKNNASRPKVSTEASLIEQMNQLRMETLINVIGYASVIAKKDPSIVHRRIDTYKKAYEEFQNKIKNYKITMDISYLDPKAVISEANGQIANNMLEEKDKYSVPNNDADKEKSVVSNLLVATCLMKLGQIGSIYRDMVEEYEYDGVYNNVPLQDNFILMIYRMKQNAGQIPKKQELTPELAEKICNDILKRPRLKPQEDDQEIRPVKR